MNYKTDDSLGESRLLQRGLIDLQQQAPIGRGFFERGQSRLPLFPQPGREQGISGTSRIVARVVLIGDWGPNNTCGDDAACRSGRDSIVKLSICASARKACRSS